MAKKNTKEKIFDVSIELFSQYGYDGVSIRQIAKELGIKINGELVTNGHSIQDVMSALQEAYGEEFAVLYNGSTISFDNKDDSGVNIIDVERMEDNLTGIAYIEDYQQLLDELDKTISQEKAAIIKEQEIKAKEEAIKNAREMATQEPNTKQQQFPQFSEYSNVS